VSLWPDPDALGTVTDLYQLTMMAGYWSEGMADHPATFELFVRRLPPGRGYLVFAGLEQAIGDIERLAFSDAQIQWLRTLPAFGHVHEEFFDWLRNLRFTGDLWSMAEGTVVHPGETLVRVTAPLAQAQWLETFLIASLNYPTLVASKAARIVDGAGGRPCVDFGARRGHGPHAGFLAARAAYLAGFAGTSHVEAARRLGIPPVGTMAHSWVQSFADEPAAFASYARTFPETTTLLIDTYDTPEGARHAAAVSPSVQAVRLDSGDMKILSRQVRDILDAADRRGVSITASGDLDEYRIADLVSAGAPIDSFGVGTELITSRDAPALSMVYKLVELDGIGRIKLAPGKKTYPLAKQVWRTFDDSGLATGDHVTGRDETSSGRPLLSPILLSGRLAAPLPDLAAIRAHCERERASLPPMLRSLDSTGGYPVTYSDLLETQARALKVQDS
jgi:nicotinate phosphoribosyltransferase